MQDTFENNAIYTEAFLREYEKLNEQQKRAVDAIEGPVMVMAGPGTGKTQVIAMRIAKILCLTQLNPENILCLTFTDAGAHAMRERLVKLIGRDGYRVSIHTFHGFCNEIILNFPEKFKEFNASSNIEDLSIAQFFENIFYKIQASKNAKNIIIKKEEMHRVHGAISKMKQEYFSAQYLQEYLEKTKQFLKQNQALLFELFSIHGNHFKEEHLQKIMQILSGTIFDFFVENVDLNMEKKQRTAFKNKIKKTFVLMQKKIEKSDEFLMYYKEYEMYLKNQNMYDYNDMLYFVIEAFKNDKDFLHSIQERYQYFLVDEFQDTNRSQMQIVELLCNNDFAEPNIFVVGDEKQSIFKFQGASFENINNFYLKYKRSVKQIPLNINYRSGQQILDCAHNLILNNQLESTELSEFNPFVELFAFNKNEESLVQKIQVHDVYEQAAYITQHIKKLIESGTEPKEIAIIYSQKTHANELIKYLKNANILFSMNEITNILHEQIVKDFICLLESANTFSAVDVFHAMNLDLFGINAMNFFDTIKYGIGDDFLEKMKNNEQCKFAIEKILSWHLKKESLELSELMEFILLDSGFYKQLMLSNDKIKSINKIITLFEYVKNHNANNYKKLDLNALLADIKLMNIYYIAIPEKPMPDHDKCIKLLTAHKSKGMEFEHVFILNCTKDGWIGSNTDKHQYIMIANGESVVNADNSEYEKRRLFYVAMTRAKKELHLIEPENKGAKKINQLIFLNEIGEENVKIVKTQITENTDYQENYFNVIPKQIFSISQEQEWIKKIANEHILSYTSFADYNSCTNAFYCKHILKLPQKASKDAAIGMAVHAVLCKIVQGLNLGKKINTNDAKNALILHLEQLKLPKEEFQNMYEICEFAIENYINNNAAYIKPGIPEYDFKKQNVEFDGIRITGRIDLVEFMDDKKHTVNLVDYKVSNSNQITHSHKDQIYFYNLIAENAYNFKYKVESGEIRFLPKLEHKAVPEISVNKHLIRIESASFEALKEKVKTTSARIKNLEFLNQNFNNCNVSECTYCDLLKKQ